jgi:hypothetical protein
VGNVTRDGGWDSRRHLKVFTVTIYFSSSGEDSVAEI